MEYDYKLRYLKALESIAASLKTIAVKPPLTVALELPLNDDPEGQEEEDAKV